MKSTYSDSLVSARPGNDLIIYIFNTNKDLVICTKYKGFGRHKKGPKTKSGAFNVNVKQIKNKTFYVAYISRKILCDSTQRLISYRFHVNF